jgi:hypothetical protein
VSRARTPENTFESGEFRRRASRRVAIFALLSVTAATTGCSSTANLARGRVSGNSRIEPDAELAERLESARRNEMGHAYARAGLWYDALAFFSLDIDQDPMNTELRIQRAALLDPIDREIVAKYDRQTIQREPTQDSN